MGPGMMQAVLVVVARDWAPSNSPRTGQATSAVQR